MNEDAYISMMLRHTEQSQAPPLVVPDDAMLHTCDLPDITAKSLSIPLVQQLRTLLPLPCKVLTFLPHFTMAAAQVCWPCAPKTSDDCKQLQCNQCLTHGHGQANHCMEFSKGSGQVG
jgi:hypothetical protein